MPQPWPPRAWTGNSAGTPFSRNLASSTADCAPRIASSQVTTRKRVGVSFVTVTSSPRQAQ
jgi:hypothetical protein